MSAIKSFFNHPITFWVLLTMPAVPMTIGYLTGSMHPHAFLHVSGEFSARFMIIAMAVTPFMLMFPRMHWPRWLLARRRYLGVAAFGYAALHTIVYLIDKGAVGAIMADLMKTGIWTGWIAFVVFVPLALTSNDWSIRRLGRSWKLLQRAVYIAAAFTVLHWIFVENEVGAALVHFVPLAGLEAFRIWKQRTKARAGIPTPA